ncbi:MAG: hypothetical protein ACJAYU_003631 [Bradymonadia bacterium]
MLDEVLTPDLIAEQLVAVYTVGRSMPPSDKAPTCENATQTRCQISWNAQTENASRTIGGPGNICVNSLTWTTDGTLAPTSQNQGSVDFGADSAVEEDVVGAQCRNGLLLVSDANSGNSDYMPFGPGNYHRYDDSLYHMDVRANSVVRVAAVLDR